MTQVVRFLNVKSYKFYLKKGTEMDLMKQLT